MVLSCSKQVRLTLSTGITWLHLSGEARHNTQYKGAMESRLASRQRAPRFSRDAPATAAAAAAITSHCEVPGWQTHLPHHRSHIVITWQP